MDGSATVIFIGLIVHLSSTGGFATALYSNITVTILAVLYSSNACFTATNDDRETIPDTESCSYNPSTVTDGCSEIRCEGSWSITCKVDHKTNAAK